MEGSSLSVVSTIPILKFLEVLSWSESAALLAKAKSLKFRSMLLISFEMDQARTLPYRTLIFPEKTFCFNRLFEQNEYSRDTVREGQSVIVADITMNRGDPMMSWSDEQVIEKVKADLSQLSYIPMKKISDVRVDRVEFAYVVPDLESRRVFYDIHHRLKEINNLHLLGRFAVGEYDNSDYAIDHGLALGAVLTGRASRFDYLSTLHTKRGREIVG